MALSQTEVDDLNKEFVAIADKQVEEKTITTDIQTRTGKSLSTKAKRVVFAEYMTELATTDYDRVLRHINCIDKAPTQRHMQNLKAETTLTKKIKIRTANNGLVKKGIATPEQVKAKGIYHVLEFPITKPVVLTKTQAIQKNVTERSITEAEGEEIWKSIKWTVLAE
tara:strand:- start:130 stop:630 length:501 start_codon:yes stop_codon:yes gene_type:complete